MSSLSGKIRQVAWLYAFQISCILHLGAQPTVDLKPAVPPPMPTLRSPVEAFRKMLAMNGAERAENLAGRPPELRNRILEKLAEYDQFKPEDREVRLRLTQLRWYMLSLIEIPATNRPAFLNQIPESDRPLASTRLAQWEQLPGEEQREILKYEKTMEQFMGQSLEGAAATNQLVRVVSPSAQPEALKNLDNFLQLPADQRQQIYGSFQRFFEMSEGEKQKTLALLPPAQQTDTNALGMLSRLPRDQREECLKAFTKFYSLTPLERMEFRRNAERWRALTPAERSAWRSLVEHVQLMPPLPPGLGVPPLPPHLPLQVSAPK